jgi:nucleotide-binding universal stress UspA family protein
MSYKSVLVHLDDDRHCDARVDIASRLALECGAHLAGLYVMSQPELPRYARSRMGADLFQDKVAELQREQADAVTARFAERTKRAGIAGAEMRVSHKDPVDVVTLHARYADVLVMGQSDPEDDQAMMNPDFVDQVLLSAGRPVLVVPYAGTFPSIGKNVLVAWNATREAARAVTDALPLLQRADKVTVFAVNPGKTGDHGKQPGADISLFLARHGVKVEAAASESGGMEVGPWLLSRAADLGSDLIVMGGYGHSRLRELALGGVTRTMLHHMTVPVMMSH